MLRTSGNRTLRRVERNVLVNGGPFLIGVGGPSGSGKSLLAARVAELLGRPPVTILPLDAYYRDLSRLTTEERARHNFDDPDAIDWPLVEQHLNLLRLSQPILRPEYDFVTHTRLATHQTVAPAQYMLFEGLYALYSSAVRGLLDLKVYVEADDAVCLGRRLERDVRERGRTPESVIEQYRHSVAPMRERYVKPTRVYADVIVDGTRPIEEAVNHLAVAIREKRFVV